MIGSEYNTGKIWSSSTKKPSRRKLINLLEKFLM